MIKQYAYHVVYKKLYAIGTATVKIDHEISTSQDINDIARGIADMHHVEEPAYILNFIRLPGDDVVEEEERA